MKTSILFTCLSIFTFVTFANDLKAEKKALIETIKSNYDSWCLNDKAEESPDLSGLNDTQDQIHEASNKETPSADQKIDHIFSDFTFRINNHQAIVQFQVDYQMISAFMEKKDGKWELVCAAIIPPEL